MKTHKIIFTLFCFLQLPFSISAQLPSIDWTKKFGSLGNDTPGSIKQLPDSSFIVFGTANGQGGDIEQPRGSEDALLVKLSAKGEKKWLRNLGGSDIERGMDVQATPDGGFILAGVTLSNDGDVEGQRGGGDAWVVKTDSLGNIQWQKCLGGSKYDEASDVKLTSDGGYIVAGATRSNDGNVTGFHAGTYGSELDMWVVKLTAAGIIEWQTALGGSGHDYATSVIQTVDGGYTVAGSTASKNGNVTGQRGAVDMWIVKLRNTGVLQWQKCLGGSLNDHANEILQTPDGGYIVAGGSDSKDKDVVGFHGYFDFWVVKLNSAGTLQWQKCLGGSGDESASSVQLAGDGGYIIGGYTNSRGGDIVGYHFKNDGWLVKINGTGKLVWQRCFGGSENDFIHSLIRTSDGKYAFASGSTSSDDDIQNHIGNNDFWIVKVGNNGQLPQNNNISCDTIDMCVGWLRDTIVRSLEDAPEKHKIRLVEKATWEGSDILIATGILDDFPFLLVMDCKGRVIQRCTYGVSGYCELYTYIDYVLTGRDGVYKIKYSSGVIIKDTIWQYNDSIPTCLANFDWQVKPTSISHTVILPKQMIYAVNNSKLRVNDRIGFFYEHNGIERCAGYGIWTNTDDVIITVYGNDTLAPAKNGLAVGDTFKIKVWDSITFQEVAASNVVYLAPGNLDGLVDATNQFTEDAFSAISILGTPRTICLDIPLKTGVNYISSYILPNDPIPVLIDTIKNKILEWKNDQGAAIIPAFDIYDESLTNWAMTEGYKVTMSAPASLKVCGTQRNTAFTALPIETGIQWIAYLKATASKPADELADWASCIKWVKNAAGDSYIPALNPPGNMTLMEATQGYKLKAACSDAIYYRDEPVTEAALQHFDRKANTGIDATLVIPVEVIQGIAAPGDEIGVFSESSALCGAAVVKANNFHITIWGDDPSTAVVEGLRQEEVYDLKIWKAQKGEERKINATIEQGLLRFQADAVQVLETAEVGTTALHHPIKESLQWSLYPNPANSQITVQFALAIDNGLVEIITSDGRSVKQVTLTGKTQQQSLGVTNLPAGMYWCKVTTDSGVHTKRFVITR